MTWNVLGRALELALLVWFFLLAVLVVQRATGGRIVLGGILADRKGEDRTFHLHRLQLVLTSVVFGVGYVLSALRGGDTGSIPDVPTVLLGGLLGSHGAFLGGKLINQQSRGNTQ